MVVEVSENREREALEQVRYSGRLQYDLEGILTHEPGISEAYKKKVRYPRDKVTHTGVWEEDRGKGN